MINEQTWRQLTQEFQEKNVRLIAVSKTKPVADIAALYALGQRDFGENYVQELVEKQPQLPQDIRWHYIGHLQSNKVKFIAPFVHLIHAVDSFKLLKEINKQAAANNRTIDVLLQLHIAEEETKFGMDETELNALLQEYFAQQATMNQVRICGLMGMATFSENPAQVRKEFKKLKDVFDTMKNRFFQGKDFFKTISMGMSGDYEIAIEEGSTMVRIGSLLFGSRG
jgi:pyridoxal phosphate enzyme (YggS family)